MLKKESIDILVKGSLLLNLNLTQSQVEALIKFTDLLLKWNRTYNLTSITEPSEVIKKHILDSLSLITPLEKYLSNSQDLLDVGSGGGLPAIPCSLIKPKVNFNLVDPVVKKARFLQQAALSLRLDNVKVFNDRVENLHFPIKFKVVTSRAFSSLENFIHLTDQLISEDGFWLAMKGKLPDEEIKRLPQGFCLETCLELKVPFLDSSRHLIVIRRQQ